MQPGMIEAEQPPEALASNDGLTSANSESPMV